MSAFGPGYGESVLVHLGDGRWMLVDSCVKAGRLPVFACSAALGRDELLGAIGSLPPSRSRRLTSGVREMRAVLEVLAAANDPGRLRWAISKRPLYQTTTGPACTVTALAPWTAVVGCREGQDRLGEIFKVPHHGPANAHQPLVWSRMLVETPEAVVCPHQRGRNRLPGKEDLERLCRMGKVHLTAPQPPDVTPVRRGRAGRLAAVDFGRVTLRRTMGGDTAWAVQYAAPAGSGC